ncbi:MAG: lipoyl synthase [Deferribacteres bacterium]|nr:lipoyl synthase [candidate division KSB1 bacterium]MCB9502260.1 lipoyl synthase [Deferribacteres bacterium]
MHELKTRRPRQPEWLKIKIPNKRTYFNLRSLVEDQNLHTVCQEAKCPNMSECWTRGTATFMILGDVCTRSCGFCAIKTGRPTWLDTDEPRRVADAVDTMKLNHAVITSVNRDELDDGGAGIFAATIREIKKRRPQCSVEVLIPDFKGDEVALRIVVDAHPEILNHNIETVPHLYHIVRPQAKYQRSLDVLQKAKEWGMTTKSGLMVGIGEKPEEVEVVLRDLRKHGVDIITIGQYMQPTTQHLPIDRYVHPKEFEHYKQFGLSLGFSHVESGPLVRSSYHADEQVGRKLHGVFD